jgi:uncharacterized membrane protein
MPDSTPDSHSSDDRSEHPHWEHTRSKAEDILNVRAEVTRRRTAMAATVDAMGHWLAHPLFGLTLLVLHLLWVILNLPIYPWFEPWDPYPFTFLATLASVEAPFIALMVLMHQKRDARIEELREEINLQVSLHVEREISILLRLVGELQEKLGVESRQDPELLDRLEEDLDAERLMEHLRERLRDAEESEEGIAP